MLKTIALVSGFLLPAVPVFAACQGEDLRRTLTPEMTVDLAKRVNETPYATGLHWTAQKDGRLLHIIGTFHLGGDAVDRVFTSIAPLVPDAALVLVEANKEEEAKLKHAVLTRPELMFITDGPTLPELMPDDDWKRLVDAASARGIPSFMAAKSQPWFLTMMLGIAPCMMAEMKSGNSGLDHQIMTAAAASNVPVQSLEPYDTLFTLFGKETMQDQIDVLLLGLGTPKEAEDMLATLMALYASEDHAEAWEINRYLAELTTDLSRAQIDEIFAALGEVVLSKRNRNWIPVIEAAPNEGPVIVAVGAGHLGGDWGVLNLLDRAGYTLNRVPLR